MLNFVSARLSGQVSETQRKRSLKQRMIIIHAVLGLALLIIVSRLIELQLVKHSEFKTQAHDQHYGGVVLPARRGEILSRNSKTGETSILATNTTLDLVYVDPLITDDPPFVADLLADILVTEQAHSDCAHGLVSCPRELIPLYGIAFDPLERISKIQTGRILEPLPLDPFEVTLDELPDITEIRRQFARSIEKRISEKRVTYVPLVYSATKEQMKQVLSLTIPGLYVSQEQRLIYANPEEIDQFRLPSIARLLVEPLQMDPAVLRRILRSRPLRYVSVMNKLPPEVSARIREAQQTSEQDTRDKRRSAPTREAAQKIQDPLRSIALIPEHWRFYPDATIGSSVVGFLNTEGEAQYGIERTFDPQLKGQKGRIVALSDLTGGQIVTGDQQVVDAKDGDTLVLTIDRQIQEEVEDIMQSALEEFDAESGQAIVMDPKTGRILAMVNVPLFDSNNYGTVFEKEPIFLSDTQQKEVVVELYHPVDNKFVLRGFYDDVFTIDGRLALTEETQGELAAIEELYNLEDISRYYFYIGENNRREIFPTERKDIWLKYRNNIGVGAYLNRTIQEIYEPGSVLKSVTMAVAIDQGEIVPGDMYNDDKPVRVDEYTIRNALNAHYGEVTMTNCLEYSINTCMTEVSMKLGRKLFHRMLERFGVGKITGIELEDELPGELPPWKKWSSALLATSAYGQGISATPLQVITAFSALANEGKLMRPTVIDSVIRTDGTIERSTPRVLDQVIRPESAETITAMLTSTVNNGFAKTAKVPGYRIAGKTGTSQIAGPGGKYEAGTGSTITSFAGYAPVDDPRFAILVKFDRPKNIEYGSESGAPVFKQIATYLFRYYGIPPDDV